MSVWVDKQIENISVKKFWFQSNLIKFTQTQTHTHIHTDKETERKPKDIREEQ